MTTAIKSGRGLALVIFILGTGVGLVLGYLLGTGGNQSRSEGWADATGGRGESSSSVVRAETNAGSGERPNTIANLDVDGQVAGLSAALQERNLGGKLDYYSLLKDMTPEAAPEVLKALKALGGQGHILTNEKRVFWERWGEIDGEAACAFIFERDKRLAQTPFSTLAIEAWARVDPVAASDWILSKEDVPLRNSMYKGFLNGFAQRDPAEAEQFIANANLTGGQKAHGYWRVARQIRVNDGYHAVAEWYKKFTPDHPQYRSLTETVTDVWTHAPVAESLAWGNSVEIDGKIAEAARNRLHNRIAHSKPDQVVEHLALQADVDSLVGADHLVERAVQRWVQTNPNAMAEWLVNNMNAKNYDFVAEPFARHIHDRDPAAAAKWAATIQDPQIRQTLEDLLDPLEE
ncbi:MAG: hypothetical protein AAGA58_15800 [Verrucomicrobiota bacterium]